MRPTRNGFTLIELVVVMSLLAAMAMSVTPVFRNSLAAARADHAARDLFAELVSAQERAVTHAVEYRVYFDRGDGTYWVAFGPFGPKGDYRTTDTIEGEPVSVPSRLEIKSVKGRPGGATGVHYLAFYPNGATDVGEVVLAERGDRRRTYRVETTGTGVRLHRPE